MGASLASSGQFCLRRCNFSECVYLHASCRRRAHAKVSLAEYVGGLQSGIDALFRGRESRSLKAALDRERGFSVAASEIGVLCTTRGLVHSRISPAGANLLQRAEDHYILIRFEDVSR